MRILMLGNSFTFYNDMPSMLAKKAGAEVVCNAAGGAELSDQLDPEHELGAATKAALENEKWDYVVIQASSRAPLRAPKKFLKNVEELCKKIRENGAVPVLFSTWAYRKDGPELAKYKLDYEEMYNSLHEAYLQAAAQNNAVLADVCEAFHKSAENARRRNLYADDGCHPSRNGSSIAAAAIAAAIKEDMKKGIVKSENLSADPSDGHLRLIYTYRILRDYTDEDHPIATNDLRRMLEEKYNISTHRTTTPMDIEYLRAAGIEIVSERRSSWLYYLAGRDFSIPELKILIDAVGSSRFITEKKSAELTKKLASLTSVHKADELKRSVHLTSRAKSDNEKGYYIVDAVNEAINLNKKISFRYFDYDSRRKKVPKNGGEPYTVSPYDLIWDGDFYYLTGFCDERGEVRTFRVDRIFSSPDILDERSVPKPASYNVNNYTEEAFRMYASGEPVTVTLMCEESVMRGIIDKFGTKARISQAGDGYFTSDVNVSVSPTFFAWVFQWDGKMKIAGPDHVLQEYQDMLKKALKE